jgi:hypothetical protein
LWQWRERGPSSRQASRSRSTQSWAAISSNLPSRSSSTSGTKGETQDQIIRADQGAAGEAAGRGSQAGDHRYGTSVPTQLKDGKELKGQAFVTTPLVLARAISKNLAEAALVARVKYTKRYDSPFGKGPVSAEAEEHATGDK